VIQAAKFHPEVKALIELLASMLNDFVSQRAAPPKQSEPGSALALARVLSLDTLWARFTSAVAARNGYNNLHQPASEARNPFGEP
jgi:hypothetical protein